MSFGGGYGGYISSAVQKMQQQGPAVVPQHTKPSLKAISATNAAVLAQQKTLVGSPVASSLPTSHSKKSAGLCS